MLLSFINIIGYDINQDDQDTSSISQQLIFLLPEQPTQGIYCTKYCKRDRNSLSCQPINVLLPKLTNSRTANVKSGSCLQSSLYLSSVHELLLVMSTIRLMVIPAVPNTDKTDRPRNTHSSQCSRFTFRIFM